MLHKGHPPRVQMPHRSPIDRQRIVVLGYLVRGPLGGMAWHAAQYALGLHRLGHDVYFVELTRDYPECYDPSHDTWGNDHEYGRKFIEGMFGKLGIGDRWAFHDSAADEWFGPCSEKIQEICASSDLLLNISGANHLKSYLLDVPIRVYVDTDPAFTQLWHLIYPEKRAETMKHNRFATFAEAVGDPSCRVPDDGFPWVPTRQPVVLDSWPVTPGKRGASFTTVMQWDSYDSVDYEGVSYGLKSSSFPPYFDLPSSAGMSMELAAGSPTVPREKLRENGWSVVDPRAPTKTPWTYQHYIQESKAEFTVAKEAYAKTNCGWFSERSAAYMASGRPVVTQETGFSRVIPSGEGVLGFQSPQQARTALHEVHSRYDFHCRRAREIAEEYFDSDKVLTALLESVLNTPPPSQ